MIHLLMLAILCGAADAQVTVDVLTDANTNVLRVSTQAITPTAGTTVTFGVPYQPDTMFARSVWTDEYGRCAWRLTASNVVVPRAVPQWSPNAAVKAAFLKRLLDRIDETTQRIIVLERWQADNIATLNRSAELTAANTKLSGLINILDGP